MTDTFNKGDKIETALATTKKELGLCGEFDRAVDEAKALHLWATHPKEALELVAGRHNRLDVFDHFKKVYNRPEYVAPEVPKVGDYVRLTFVDGSTKEGEVSRLNPTIAKDRVAVYLRHGLPSGAWIPLTAEAVPVVTTWTVVKVEHIEKPVEIPEIGRWIKATTADGKEHVLEVTKNENGGRDNKTVFLQHGSNFDSRFVREAPATLLSKERHITKWEYTEKPFPTGKGAVIEAHAKGRYPSLLARTADGGWVSLTTARMYNANELTLVRVVFAGED